MDIFLLDAIGPFFCGVTEHRVNWSKIPFAHFHTGGRLDEERLVHVAPDFEMFCARAAAIGYNAITLDDVAHLADSPDYPPAIREIVAGWRRCFKTFFAAAAKHGLKIYLTSDLMFFPADADEVLQKKMKSPEFLAGRMNELFAAFPEVAGVIVRLGESDGLDVRDVFRSRLVIRTPRDCRRWIAPLLAACEANRRDLIVRTWSVGAHRVGDLIWNRDTLRRVFDSFESERLIVSMKFGETDFFRFLPLNPQLFRGRHRKIIELQARREYEGCGEYPSFIGWDYQRYRDQLCEGGANVCGIMVWCQTGGWTIFRRLTFLPTSSVWNEINTWVTLRIFRDGMSAERAIADWCRASGRADCAYDVLQLLRLSDQVIREALYMDEFAVQKLFFRRLRVPPLLWVYWDQIIVNHAVSRALDCFVLDGRRQIQRAADAGEKCDRMHVLALRCHLPADDIVFMRDTFEILAAARDFFFLPASQLTEQRIRALSNIYRQKHPARHYTVRMDFRPARLARNTIARVLRILIRRERGYRWMDRIITLRLLSWLYPLFRSRTKMLPDFAHDRAMGIDTVFK